VRCSVRRVSINPTALSDANVFLYSVDNSSARWIINGQTDSNGNAQLFTLATAQIRKSGAPEGQFKVTVTKDLADELPMEPIPAAPAEEHSTFREKMRQLKPHIHYFVEETHTNPNTTPLEVTIEKNKNTFSLDAGKKTKRSIPMQLW